MLLAGRPIGVFFFRALLNYKVSTVNIWVFFAHLVLANVSRRTATVVNLYERLNKYQFVQVL